MNTTLNNLLRGTAVAAALLTSLASQAADGQDAHQRYLDGEPQAASISSGTQLVPGSYARYLAHYGMPLSQALAKAEATGEYATLVTATPAAPTQLSSYQVYQRNFGIAPTL